MATMTPKRPTGRDALSLRSMRVTGGSGRRGPGTSASTGVGPDTTAPFRPPILIIRLGTTAISAILALGPLLDGNYETAAWAGVIVAYTVFRTLRPLRFEDNTISFLRVLFEAGLMTAAVASTGYWESPLVFSLLTAVAVAGFARGFAFAFEIAIATISRSGSPTRCAATSRATTCAWPPSGPSRSCSWHWLPDTPGGSAARPTSSTPSPSTGSAG